MQEATGPTSHPQGRVLTNTRFSLCRCRCVGMGRVYPILFQRAHNYIKLALWKMPALNKKSHRIEASAGNIPVSDFWRLLKDHGIA